MTWSPSPIDSGYVPWSPIVERPRWTWPAGARVAVCVLVHLEHAELCPAPDTIIPRSLVHRGPYPEIPDFHEVTPHEYGNRVGFWRLKQLLDGLSIPVTAAVDGIIAGRYQAMIDACLDSKWELAGHAPISNRVLTEKLREEEERAYLQDALDALIPHLGRRPRGWAGVDFAQTSRTVRLLAELGVEYCCDWPNDEQPYEMSVSTGSLVSLPVSIHLDDVHAHHRRGISMSRWSRMVTESFDRLHAEGTQNARLLVLSLHPWLTGQPFRIRHVEAALAHIAARSQVWFATGGEIVDAFRGREASRDDQRETTPRYRSGIPSASAQKSEN